MLLNCSHVLSTSVICMYMYDDRQVMSVLLGAAKRLTVVGTAQPTKVFLWFGAAWHFFSLFFFLRFSRDCVPFCLALDDIFQGGFEL